MYDCEGLLSADKVILGNYAFLLIRGRFVMLRSFQANDPRRDRFVYTSPKKHAPVDDVFVEFSKCMCYFTVQKSH